MSEFLPLTMFRNGEFAVHWGGSNATQCGARGTQILRYEVEMVSREDLLNQQGFIIDNNHVHDYFVDTFGDVQDFLSCERIASQACRDLKHLVGEGRLLGIRVTVSGGPNARMMARWKPTRRSTLN